MSDKNKVKYNLSNVHYAKLLTDTADGATFGEVVAIPGAVSISLTPNGEPEKFYADGYVYYTINNNMGYDGDLEIALVPESFKVDIMNEEKDANGVLIENSDSEINNFALMFEFDGDVNKIRHVLYKCAASRATMESATKTDSLEVKTETLSFAASPLACRRIKGCTSEDTPDDVQNAWYNTVYLPISVAAGTDSTDTSDILALDD